MPAPSAYSRSLSRLHAPVGAGRLIRLARRWLPCGFLAVLAAFQIFPRANEAWRPVLVLVIGLMGWMLTGACERQLQAVSPLDAVRARKFSMVFGIGCALLLSLAIPLSVRHHHHLRIDVLGQHAPDAKGSEVWITGLRVASGGTIPFSARALPAPWVWRDGLLMAGGAKAGTLDWSGWTSEDLLLSFVRHPWSGKVRVDWDGQAQNLDLYSLKGSGQLVRLTDDSSPASWPGVALAGMNFLALMLAAYLTALAWITRPVTAVSAEKASTSPQTWLAQAGSCAVIWAVFYWLPFWPAVMSSDSLDQWVQVHRGVFSNHHPAFHTFTNWALTRIWDSPGMIAGAQIIALALCFGWCMGELAAWGVPGWIRWVATGLFAASPVNGIFSITLWKDIPYAICFLLTSGLLLRLARIPDLPVRSRRFLVALFLALTGVALYRHNGVGLVALLGLTVPWFVARSARFRLWVVFGAAMATFIAFTWGVYPAVGVKPLSAEVKVMGQIHSMGAMIASGVVPSDEQRKVLEEFAPLDVWRSGYYCYSVNGSIYSPGVRPTAFDRPEMVRNFERVWWQMGLQHLDILVRHQLCVDSMVWRILSPPDGYLYTDEFGIIPNQEGLMTRSKWPRMREAWISLYGRTGEASYIWWIWRPALYLYLAVFLAVLAARRYGEPRILFWALPSALQSLVLMAANPAQDFRYQYGVYLVGFVTPALLFLRPARIASARSQETTQSSLEQPGLAVG